MFAKIFVDRMNRGGKTFTIAALSESAWIRGMLENAASRK